MWYRPRREILRRLYRPTSCAARAWSVRARGASLQEPASCSTEAGGRPVASHELRHRVRRPGFTSASSRSKDRLASFDPGSEQVGESSSVDVSVTEGHLVELGALEVEVEVVFPREADAAVDL